MKLRRIVQATKTITDSGTWKTGSKMPKSAFPLSKSSQFKVSSTYTWKVISFDALGERFRVLIYYRIALHQYSAVLAKAVGGDMLVMARLEFHGTHPGWHCHALCDATGAVSGRSGAPDKRIPKVSGFHKQSEYGVAGDRSAHDKAAKFFRLDKHPLPPLFQQPNS